MAFTATEQEAIVLTAVWSMIDDMVNFANFAALGDRTEQIVITPRTSDTRRLFHILLGDFLSPLASRKGAALPFDLPRPDAKSLQSDFTFLFYLRRIAADPKLGSEATELARSVRDFAAWLEQESIVEKVWLPSIDVEVDLKIRRISWIKICADIGKHSFARLETNVRKVVQILGAHERPVDEGMGYTVLPEFWEWFHTHLFAYHLSTIAEFLNNIRWAIFDYLGPEYAAAYRETSVVSGLQLYDFTIPEEIGAPLARTMYVDLMNRVRARPFFPRFSVTDTLKLRF